MLVTEGGMAVVPGAAASETLFGRIAYGIVIATRFGAIAPGETLVALSSLLNRSPVSGNVKIT